MSTKTATSLDRELGQTRLGRRKLWVDPAQRADQKPCHDLAAAKVIVATDPLVTSGEMRAELAEWQLVGIDLGAVDDRLT
jgi:hypothetical protein